MILIHEFVGSTPTTVARRTPQDNEKLSPQEELVNDLISIIHVFSCKIYGLRKYKKQIKEDKEIAKELQDRNKSQQ